MFYENFKAACDKRGTTPAAVVSALGMSRSNTTEWKRGSNPNLNSVFKVAEFLKVSPSFLLRGSRDRKEVE